MIRHPLIGVLLLCALSTSAFGQQTWTNGNSTGLWSDPLNWTTAEPTALDDVTLPNLLGGTITLGAGELANGFLVDDSYTFSGGDLSISGLVDLTAGNTLTAQNNTQLNFAGSYEINDGTTFDIQSGADFSTDSWLDIGNSAGDGTLIVDGAGSTVTTDGLSLWGFGGDTANVTFRNGSTGNIGGIALAGSAAAGSTGIFNVESAATVTTDVLFIASVAGISVSGTITVDGSGSTLTQNAVSTLTVGHSTFGFGTATIDVTNGGTFTTGTGTITVNKTGTINVGLVGDGTFNANDDVVVYGGTIMLGNSPSDNFNLATGRTVTATNDALIDFAGSYVIADGTTFDIQSGADFSTGDSLDIGGSAPGGDGTLIVDGAGSTVITGPAFSFWGLNGNSADVTFRNGSAGNLGPIFVAGSSTAGTTAIFNVESAATVTTDSLTIATFGGTTTSGTITVDGPGSTLTQNGASTLTVGHATTGTATIDVTGGGTFTTGTGLTTIETTGALNVNTAGTFTALGNINLSGTINLVGGTLSAVDVVFTGSTFSFPFGTLELNSNQTLDTQRLADLDVGTIGTGKTFRVVGISTLLAPLTLAGGTFATESLGNASFLDFQTGTLGFTGAGGLTIGAAGPLGSAVTVAAGQEIDVTNTATVQAGATLEVQTGGNFAAGTLANSGQLSGTGTVAATLANAASGEVFVGTGEQLRVNGSGHTNAGQFTLASGTLHFDGDVTNQSTGLIFGTGTYRADGGTANDGTLALSATSNVIGDVINNASGQITVTGGTTTFFDDVTNDGTLQISEGATAVFFGTLDGANGTVGTGAARIEADLKPGSSPAAISFGGDLTFGAGATVTSELSGTTAGSQFDQVNVAGDLTIEGGTLEIELINSFDPSPGESFELFTYQSRSGEFDQINGDGLLGDVYLLLQYGATDATLLAALPGDASLDGQVDIGDFTIWGDGFQTGSEFIEGDFSGDGEVDIGDFTIWGDNFGNTAGGFAPFATSVNAVPEPSTFALLAVGVLAIAVYSRRRREK